MMAVSKRTRYEVLRRDENRCRYCHATENPLTVDHVTPVALGGTDDPSNLVAACKDCNAGKSSASPDATLVAQVESDAVRWAAALAKAAEIVGQEEDALGCYQVAFYRVWDRWTPSDVDGTLRALFKAGLPEALMVDAAQIALAARGVDDRFRYFCGVAWKKVKRIQEVAAELASVNEPEPEPNADDDDELSPLDEAWLKGYDVATNRYWTTHVHSRMLSSVVDGVTGGTWGAPAWWTDLHPRKWAA